MGVKIQTIHHVALAFFPSEQHCLKSLWDSYPDSDQILYEGDIDNIEYDLAKSIVEVHPNFSKYYEFAGMPLYKTYSFKSGTECPVLALKTRRSKAQRDEDHKYVVIWKIFED